MRSDVRIFNILCRKYKSGDTWCSAPPNRNDDDESGDREQAKTIGQQ